MGIVGQIKGRVKKFPDEELLFLLEKKKKLGERKR